MLEVRHRRSLRRLFLGFCLLIGLVVLVSGLESVESYVSENNIDESVQLQNEDLLDVDELNSAEGDFSRDQSFKNDEKILGYIVEFEEEPLAVKESETRGELEENKEYLSRSSRYNPRNMFVRAFGVTEEEDLEIKVGKHEERIEEEHKKVKSRIAKEIGANLDAGERGFAANVISEITGRVVDDSEGVEVAGEYKNVFNGIALNVSAEEAERIKKIKGVKSVEPDYGVRALLSDSVPLIGADKVWELDAQQGACATSGKECLTGKGVKIAIIDTGVDYTHPDLGNGCYKPGQEKSGSGNGVSGITGQVVKGEEIEKCASVAAFFDEEVKGDVFELTERLNAAGEKKSVSTASGIQSLCASEAKGFSRQVGALVEERKELLEKLIEENPEAALEVPALSDKVAKTLSRSERSKFVEQRKNVQGYLDVLHVDDFENPDNSKFLYSVRDKENGQSIQVFSNRHLEPSLANSEVRVHGLAVGNKMAVGISAFEVRAMAENDKLVQAVNVIEKPKTEQEENLGDQKTLVIVVGFDGKKPPVTVEAARKMVFDKNPGEPLTLKIKKGESKSYYFADMEYKILYEGMNLQAGYAILDINAASYNARIGKTVDGSFNGFTINLMESSSDSELMLLIQELKVNDYYAENSYGKVNLAGDVVGRYELPKPSGSDPLDMALEAAMKDIKNFDYDRVILAMSYVDGECGGCGTLGKMNNYMLPNGKTASFSVSWDSSFGRGLVGHELGHNFGAHHANSYVCHNREGADEIYFSTNCQSYEYGDPYDIMGQGSGATFNAPHKSEVGWLPVENTAIATEGTFLIKPINSVQNLGILQQLRIPALLETGFYAGKNDVYYSVSFKKKTDTDWNINEPGEVFVHLEEISTDGSIKSIHPNLVDLDLNGKSYSIAPGKAMLDTLNGISIKLDKIDSEGAMVSISKIPASSLPDFDEPLIYYDFLDIANEKVKDRIGNADGNLIDASQRFGGVYVNGFESYVKLNDFQTAFIKKNNAFTASQWVNLKENNFGNLLNFGSYYLRIDPDGIAVEGRFNIQGSAYSMWTFFNIKKKINDGNWHHIATRYNGIELGLYIDGKKEGSIDYVRDSNDKLFPLGDMDLNSYDHKTKIGYALKGVLDEFKIYARALSDEEIKREFENFKPELVDYEKLEPFAVNVLLNPRPQGFSMGQDDYNLKVDGILSEKVIIGIRPARNVEDKEGYEFKQIAKGEKGIFGKNGELEIMVEDFPTGNEVRLKITPVKKEGVKDTGCKVISGYDFVNNDNDPMDDHGHGTHVAATAAGKGDANGNGKYDKGELWGVAPDAQIIAYKVLDGDGGGTEKGIIDAIERAVDPNGDGKFDDKVDIISMSLGGSGDPDDAQSKAVDNAVKAGVVVVVAAGNSGPRGNPNCAHGYGGRRNSICSPGTARSAITVAASDKGDKIAGFSSRGPVEWLDADGQKKYLMKPDVSAPGVDICAAQSSQDTIWSTVKNGKSKKDLHCKDEKHISISGTSMATPHVAGAAALLKQAHKDWTPEEVKSALRSTSADIIEVITNQGYGRISTYQSLISNKPLSAKIDILQDKNKKLSIYGNAQGDNFDNYHILIGKGENPTDWTNLYTSFKPVNNNILYSDFNSAAFKDGIYRLKLIVESTDGILFKDNTLFSLKNIQITSPLNNDVLRMGDTISINGLISSSDFKNYKIEYASGLFVKDQTWKSEGITLSDKGLKEKDNEVLATWDTSSLTEPGFYTLRLTTEGGKTGIQEIFVHKLYFNDKIKKGWPQYVDYRGSFVQYNHLIPTVADLDGDGKKEVIVIDASGFQEGKSQILIVYNFDGSVRFVKDIQTDTTGGVVPIIGDLEGDGNMEILVESNGDTSRLYGFHADGKEISGKWPIEGHSRAIGTIIADLDKNGKNEVISRFLMKKESKDQNGNLEVGEFIMIFDDLGLLINKFEVKRSAEVGEQNGVEVFSAIGNYDEDSDLEIATHYSHNGVAIYERTGEMLPGWPQFTKGITIWSSLVSADINKDGHDELIVGSSKWNSRDLGGMYVFDGKGNLLPGWPALTDVSFHTGIVGHVTEKENLNIVAIGNYREIYVFDSTGKVSLGWPAVLSKYTLMLNSPALLDINKDGRSEIITASSGIQPALLQCGDIEGSEGLSIWNFEGQKISLNSLSNNGILFSEVTSSYASPTVTDLEGDGKLDVVFASEGNFGFCPLKSENAARATCNEEEKIIDDACQFVDKNRATIYAVTLPFDYDPTNSWSQFQYDSQHTGCYDCMSVAKKEVEGGKDGTCHDEDGMDATKSGKVTDEGRESKDVCVSSNEVREYYCAYNEEKKRESMRSYVEQCDGNCVNGACQSSGKVCLDEEPEDDLEKKGVVKLGGERYEDRCEEEGKSVREYLCDGDKLKSFVKRCSTGMNCFEGVCR